MEDVEIGGHEFPKSAVVVVAILIVGGVLILFVLPAIRSASTPASTTETPAAPSGALQAATNAQDLTTLNNNEATYWQTTLQAISQLESSANSPAPSTPPTNTDALTAGLASITNQFNAQQASIGNIKTSLSSLESAQNSITNQTTWAQRLQSYQEAEASLLNLTSNGGQATVTYQNGQSGAGAGELNNVFNAIVKRGEVVTIATPGNNQNTHTYGNP